MPVEHDNNKANIGSGGGSSNVIDGVTVSGTPTSGQVITATSGTAANWQSIPFPKYSGSGSPEGHQVGNSGDSYRDTFNGAIWWKVQGTGNTGWVMTNVVDSTAEETAPSPVGVGVIDITGSLYLLNVGPIPASGTAQSVIISDQNGVFGSGNAISWLAGSADFEQSVQIVVGSECASYFNANGAVGLNSNGPGGFGTPFSSGEISMGQPNPNALFYTGAHSISVSSNQTTTATPTALTLTDGTSSSYNFLQNTSTALVSGKLIATRSDGTHTASSWTLPDSLIRSSGTALVWVSGSAPTFTLVQRDSAASAWTATIAISGNNLVCTVTGAASQTIQWLLTLTIDRLG